jgi:hypothetical protein
MNEPKTSNNDLAQFQRTVATCLSIVPLLFAGQGLLAILSSMNTEAVLRDLGTDLPMMTQIAMSWRPIWVGIVIILPLAAVFVSRKRPPVTSVVFSTACGLVLFAVSQYLNYSTWLPFAHLISVLSK